MSILKEEIGEQMMVSAGGRPPAPMKQKLVTHKIRNDKDMVDFQAEMIKGRDIVLSVTVGDATYVMVREFIPMKLAVPGKGDVK